MVRTERSRGTLGGRSPAAFRAVLRLVRWENCVFAFGAVAVGFASAHAPHRSGWRLLVAGTVVVLVLAFGNVVNDILDEEADRRSKAWRPLPSGALARTTAVRLALALPVVTVVVASALGLVLFGVAMLVLGLAYSYSARLKAIPLLGNLAVALQVGSTILFGALAAGEPSGATVVGSVLLLLYSFCLEVAKTIEDADVDRSVGMVTVAHAVDPQHHGTVILLLASLSAAVAVGAGLVLGVPVGYWLVIAPDVPLLCLAGRLLVSPPNVTVPLARSIRTSKALWLVGLLGLATIV